jgi:Pyridoxamine 5'-phosphate oxidase
VRSLRERQDDVLARLQNERQAWIATAGGDSQPHLVPLSLCWHQDEILLATRADRPIARNISESGHARVGLGAGDDVVLIDAAASAEEWHAAAEDERRAFIDRTGWDPSKQAGVWALLRLRPRRVRAWRSAAENVRGSVVMSDGQWL